MSKAPTGKPSTDLAPAAQSGGALIDASTLDFFASHQGAGMENIGMDDITMPRISILQSLSPQLKRNKPEFIEGAKEGQLFNAATKRAFDTLNVIPCHYVRHHIEWRPNRGGFVADHGEEGKNLLARYGGPARLDDKKFDILPNGNILIPTPTWYCLDIDNDGQQVVIPMPRTQQKASKDWMSAATSERIPHPQHGMFTPPLFYRSWQLGSFERSEGENDWFVFTVKPGASIIELERPEFLAAATRFRDALLAGDIKADAASFADEQMSGNRSDEGAM
jgi:hypothetical protein